MSEWNQCTDGGLFKIYIWEDHEGFPGDDIFSELQLTDNRAGWNHSIISTSGISNSGDLWVGIREYTATQAIGMDADNEGCSSVDNGDGWETLEGGNLAYRLTTCLDDNPAGCFSTGCPDNYVCLDDWENNLEFFVKVMPLDYKRVITERRERNEEIDSIFETNDRKSDRPGV